MAKIGTKLGLVDLVQMYSPVEVYSGQEQYYMTSALHLVSLCVSLTFGQTYPLVEASNGQDLY